jgi:hypothetical protein
LKVRVDMFEAKVSITDIFLTFDWGINIILLTQIL